MPVIIQVTNKIAEKMSRQEMLNWVNKLLLTKYKKIDELYTGVAYCQLMETLIPGSVVMKKLKINAKLEHEFIHNFRLFQSAFTKLGVNKNIPIEKLVKGKFQDNFEFLQWFKQFYDLNSNDKENLNETISSDNLKSSENLYNNDIDQLKKVLSQSSVALNALNKQTTNTPIRFNKINSKTESSLGIEERRELTNQISVLHKEREFLYSKLKEIEILLSTENYTNITLKNVKDVVSSALSKPKSVFPNKMRRVSFKEQNNLNHV